jgi:hypothetical protein
VPALTYLDLYQAVLGFRFPQASQLTNSKRWVDTAYQDVWSAADWTFRRVPLADLAVSDATPDMPTDFADVIDLFDPSGYRLERLSQEDFERYYAPSLATASVGTSAGYAVVNRQVYLSSAGSGTYKLSYRRRMAHKDTGGAVVAGPMSVDTDKPLWDDHHSILIPRAQAIGLQEINDPTWEQPQAEYERQLSRMKQDYEQVRPAEQWGRDCSYA